MQNKGTEWVLICSKMICPCYTKQTDTQIGFKKNNILIYKYYAAQAIWFQ